jgi:DNA-directed RNA polymerase specialized sigma24 family protein
MNYVKNKDLWNELVKSKAEGELTDEAWKMIQLIVENSIRKYSASDYDKDDYKQEAYFRVLKFWRTFDPEYKNAFAWVTQICIVSFIGQYKTFKWMKKDRNLTIVNLNNYFSNGEFNV